MDLLIDSNADVPRQSSVDRKGGISFSVVNAERMKSVFLFVNIHRIKIVFKEIPAQKSLSEKVAK